MIASFRKIVSRAMAFPFACAVLTACLLESGINSAPAKPVLDATIRVGIEPWGLAFTPDGKYLYVANYGSNTVSVIDTASNQVSSTITHAPGSGVFLASKAITPDGSTVFVLGAQSTIVVISTSTNTVLKTISAGAQVSVLAWRLLETARSSTYRTFMARSRSLTWPAIRSRRRSPLGPRHGRSLCHRTENQLTWKLSIAVLRFI